jgi:diguanylate cyclase (GGDEF)-like protein/PAS domain S-box-containing protein
MNRTKYLSIKGFCITKTSVLSIIVLGIGFLLTVLEWRQAIEVITAEDQMRFEQEANNSLANIQKRMGTYQQVLRGVKGLFVASDKVNRSEFKAYTEQLDLEINYPGILGVGFSLLVQPYEREQHILNIQAEGFPLYKMSPNDERDLYTSIVFLEPFSGNNLNAFGFDMYSEKVRREAMDKSRLTNALALSRKVSLVQDAERGPISGVLLYLPVYQNKVTQQEDNTANLFGWVYAPFSMDILMEGIQLNESQLHLSIYDGTEVGAKTELYTSVENVKQSNTPVFQQIEQLVIAQRTWTVVFSAERGFIQSHDNTEPIVVLFVGSLFSVLITLLVWSLSTSKTRAESKAERMNKELIETEFRWKSALSGAEHGVWDWNHIDNTVSFDTKWKTMLGYTDDEIKNEFSEWRRLVHPMDWERAEIAIADFVSGKTKIYNLEQRLKGKDGRWIWIICRGDVVSWTEDGRIARSIGTHTDITTQKNLELALTESDQRFRGAFETAAIGIALVGLDGEWLEVNQSLLNMLQYEEAELFNLTFQDITHPEDLNLDLEHLRELQAGKIPSYQMEKRYYCKDRSIVWAYLSVSMVVDVNGNPVHFVSQVENITERKELQIRVLHQASHDELTGLPNRRLLKERLKNTFDLNHRYKRLFAVMYIDIDHFKHVNDLYGHDIGDELLVWLSNKLIACVRTTDTLARQGGDEFVMILSGINSPNDATLVANKILHEVGETFVQGSVELKVSLSIGIAMSDVQSKESIEELLRRADIALYQVKRSGRNGFKLYEEDGEQS